MKCLPINIDITGRKVLVVGGGTVACRKVKTLQEYGADVTVVSPHICKPLARLKHIRFVRRRYRKGDIRGVCLIVGATDSVDTNGRIHEHAVDAGIPVNIVDQPNFCTFIFPAIVSRGDLSVAISTGGASPALAKEIRKSLETTIGPEFEKHVELLREMRALVLGSTLDAHARSTLLKELAGAKIRKTIKTHGIQRGRELAKRLLATALRNRKDKTS